MTNEEKAIEIGGTSSFGHERYKAALEMAQWKEQQLIQKAVAWMRNNINFHDNSGGYERDAKLEEFKQSMMED